MFKKQLIFSLSIFCASFCAEQMHAAASSTPSPTKATGNIFDDETVAQALELVAQKMNAGKSAPIMTQDAQGIWSWDGVSEDIIAQSQWTPDDLKNELGCILLILCTLRHDQSTQYMNSVEMILKKEKIELSKKKKKPFLNLLNETLGTNFTAAILPALELTEHQIKQATIALRRIQLRYPRLEKKDAQHQCPDHGQCTQNNCQLCAAATSANLIISVKNNGNTYGRSAQFITPRQQERLFALLNGTHEHARPVATEHDVELRKIEQSLITEIPTMSKYPSTRVLAEQRKAIIEKKLSRLYDSRNPDLTEEEKQELTTMLEKPDPALHEIKEAEEIKTALQQTYPTFFNAHNQTLKYNCPDHAKECPPTCLFPKVKKQHETLDALAGSGKIATITAGRHPEFQTSGNKAKAWILPSAQESDAEASIIRTAGRWSWLAGLGLTGVTGARLYFVTKKQIVAENAAAERQMSFVQLHKAVIMRIVQGLQLNAIKKDRLKKLLVGGVSALLLGSAIDTVYWMNKRPY